MWDVAELAEVPGAEHGPDAEHAQVAFSVPVPAKMVGHHLPQLGDLDVQDVDQLHLWKIHQHSSLTHVYVAKIIGTTVPDNQARTQDYNALIPGVWFVGPAYRRDSLPYVRLGVGDTSHSPES